MILFRFLKRAQRGPGSNPTASGLLSLKPTHRLLTEKPRHDGKFRGLTAAVSVYRVNVPIDTRDEGNRSRSAAVVFEVWTARRADVPILSTRRLALGVCRVRLEQASPNARRWSRRHLERQKSACFDTWQYHLANCPRRCQHWRETLQMLWQYGRDGQQNQQQRECNADGSVFPLLILPCPLLSSSRPLVHIMRVKP